MWRRVRRSKPLVIGGLMVVLLVLSALAAPALATHDPIDQNIVQRLAAPGQGGHVLGTDEFGRDIWSRLVYGARISLWAGFLAVGIGAIAGLLLG